MMQEHLAPPLILVCIDLYNNTLLHYRPFYFCQKYILKPTVITCFYIVRLNGVRNVKSNIFICFNVSVPRVFILFY